MEGPPRVGKHTHERGLESEARVLEACRLASRPQWMRAARLASRMEDRSGIDVVIDSDAGRLCVQVKSSRLGKEHFRPRAFLSIAVVVVHARDAAEAILAKVVAELEPIRAEYLARQAAIDKSRSRGKGRG